MMPLSISNDFCLKKTQRVFDKIKTCQKMCSNFQNSSPFFKVQATKDFTNLVTVTGCISGGGIKSGKLRAGIVDKKHLYFLNKSVMNFEKSN